MSCYMCIGDGTLEALCVSIPSFIYFQNKNNKFIMVFFKKYFQYILILVSTIGCTDKQTEFNDIMYVDNEDVLGKFDVSDLVESIVYIKFKEKEDSFVGGIYKLSRKYGPFILFDRFVTQKIFLFSSDGTFLKEM